MKKKIAWAVFSHTEETGKEYMVKGNFGNDKKAANDWLKKNEHTFNAVTARYEYPRGLFIKKIEY